MSERNRRSTRTGTPKPAAGTPAADPASASRSPSATARAGRRTTPRRRYDEPSAFERFRTPILAAIVVIAVVGVTLFVFQSASAATFSCASMFDPAERNPQEGRFGAVQPDMGQDHVSLGTNVRYPACPPASGDHVNREGFGPLEPEAYGPDDRAEPQGWIHNLEHGGMVILYSCEQGACDEASLAALEAYVRDFDVDSPVCKFPPRTISPVVAKFDQMPARYAAVTWGRVMYMDEFDADVVTQMYLTESERLGEDGTLISPPEKLCTPASPSPSASASSAPSASPSAPASAAPSASTPAASPSGSTAPSTSPSPSPSAS